MVERESNVGGSIVATLVGFACGVGVGLLFAKKPGSETRQDIADLINKGRRKGERLLQQGRERLSGAAEGIASEGGKEPFYESGKYT